MGRGWRHMDCTLQGSKRRSCYGWYFCSVTFSKYILTAFHELTMTLRKVIRSLQSHSFAQQIFIEHKHVPGPLSTSIREFFRSTLKHKVWLSSHPPSFPVISHSPGFVILKISSKCPVLSWPDSHKSLGNCPNSLTLLSTLHLHPRWTSLRFPAPPGSSASGFNLSSLLFQSFFLLSPESADQRILKLQVVPSSSPN